MFLHALVGEVEFRFSTHWSWNCTAPRACIAIRRAHGIKLQCKQCQGITIRCAGQVITFSMTRCLAHCPDYKAAEAAENNSRSEFRTLQGCLKSFKELPSDPREDRTFFATVAFVGPLLHTCISPTLPQLLDCQNWFNSYPVQIHAVQCKLSLHGVSSWKEKRKQNQARTGYTCRSIAGGDQEIAACMNQCSTHCSNGVPLHCDLHNGSNILTGDSCFCHS